MVRNSGGFPRIYDTHQEQLACPCLWTACIDPGLSGTWPVKLGATPVFVCLFSGEPPFGCSKGNQTQAWHFAGPLIRLSNPPREKCKSGLGAELAWKCSAGLKLSMSPSFMDSRHNPSSREKRMFKDDASPNGQLSQHLPVCLPFGHPIVLNQCFQEPRGSGPSPTQKMLDASHKSSPL